MLKIRRGFYLGFLDVSIIRVASDPHCIGQIMDVYPLIGGTYDLLIQEWLKPPNTYHYTFPSIDISDDLRRKFEFWKFNGSKNMTKKHTQTSGVLSACKNPIWPLNTKNIALNQECHKCNYR